MKLAILLALFLFLRLFPIALYNFPYSYDNAKDSLVMQEMWEHKKPALLGAVTSMEGLYQGPAWYYVMLPLNVLFGFDPIASVLTVIGLGLFTAWLLYRHVGVLEAFLFATSSAVVATQQTAWSPYLTLFSTTWVLIVLFKLASKPKTILLLLLAFSLSLLFHAEIAFAVVFLLLTIVVLWRRRVRPTIAQAMLSVLVFGSLFLPQAVFELRHDFLQTRAVIHFVAHYKTEGVKVQENKTGVARIGEVVTIMSQNAIGSLSPTQTNFSDTVAVIIVILFGLSFYSQRKKLTSKVSDLTLPILFGSFAMYLFLPLKPFYLVGLIPVWIFLGSDWIRTVYPKKKYIFALLWILVASIAMIQSKSTYSIITRKTNILFAPKLAAVDAAYTLADGHPFVSYQYVPEVYDYSYQHIYQYTAKKYHRSVPVEYAYAPGETAYMTTQKAVATNGPVESTILIVEADPRPQFFPVWWEKMIKGKTIIATERINDAITVYKVQ